MDGNAAFISSGNNDFTGVVCNKNSRYDNCKNTQLYRMGSKP